MKTHGMLTVKTISFCLFLIFLLPFTALGQPDLREAVIEVTPTPAGYRFSARTPPLHPIPGAPPPFYTYYWEFGDGTFSFEENPVHIYEEPGDYDARLYLTNNYDEGKPPPSRPKGIRPRPGLLASMEGSAGMLPVIKDYSALRLQSNHQARPDDELVCILTYKNRQDRPAGGRLFLFFNERKYANTHFELAAFRAHHGEKILPGALVDQAGFLPLWKTALAALPPALIEEPASNDLLREQLSAAHAEYRTSLSWQFEDLAPGEERHLFISLRTTPEMLADTNALVTLRSLYAPDGGDSVESHILELDIVASHDPNHLAVSDVRRNYRRKRRGALDYRVRFQNTGQGPASEIEITCRPPAGLDPASLQILDYSPQCYLCSESNRRQGCLDTIFEAQQLRFRFKGVYLAGLKQKGVRDRDSTMGFVKFRLDPRPKVRRYDLTGRAAIVFDDNPPIQTNAATTRFTGWAPGLKAGVTLFMGSSAAPQPFIGLTYAPFRPAAFFYQAEVMLYPLRQEKMEAPPCPETGPEEIFTADSIHRQTTRWMIDIVPLQLRKNFGEFLSAGAGMQVSTEWRREVETDVFEGVFLSVPFEPILCRQVEPYVFTASRRTASWFPGVAPGLFADLNAGSVKSGPALGLRYLWFFRDDRPDQLQVYAQWKF